LIDYRDKYKVYLGVAAGGLLVLVLSIWLWNAFSGEEGRIRKFILQGKKSVESENIFSCADLVSMRYQDKYGNDRQGLIFATKEAFGYYKQISVDVKSMEINLDDSKTQASVEIRVSVVGWAQDKLEKILEGQKERIRIRLVKEDKKWHLLELEFHEPVTIMEQNIIGTLTIP